MAELILREATVDDVPFMQARLYEAAMPPSIPQEYLPSFETALTFGWMSRYLTEWGRPDDLGIVAVEDGMPVGAAWCRRYTPEEMRRLIRLAEKPLPPHEVAIGLMQAARGRGIGTIMLGGLLERLTAQGVEQVCLSVDVENEPARRLYRGQSFMAVGSDRKAEIMVRKSVQPEPAHWTK